MLFFIFIIKAISPSTCMSLVPANRSLKCLKLWLVAIHMQVQYWLIKMPNPDIKGFLLQTQCLLKFLTLYAFFDAFELYAFLRRQIISRPFPTPFCHAFCSRLLCHAFQLLPHHIIS